MTQKRDQSEGKPQNLIKCGDSGHGSPAPAGRIRGGEAAVASNGTPEGGSLRVTGAQTPGVSSLPASLDTAGSARGPREQLTGPQPQEGPERPPRLVCSERLPLHEWSFRGRLSPGTEALLQRGCNFELFYHIQL